MRIRYRYSQQTGILTVTVIWDALTMTVAGMRRTSTPFSYGNDNIVFGTDGVF